MLSVPNCFVRPKEKLREADDSHNKFKHHDGDHLSLLNAFLTFK